MCGVLGGLRPPQTPLRTGGLRPPDPRIQVGCISFGRTSGRLNEMKKNVHIEHAPHLHLWGGDGGLRYGGDRVS